MRNSSDAPTQTFDLVDATSSDASGSERRGVAATSADARRLVEDSLQASTEHEEHVGSVIRMRKAVLIAMIVWPSFYLVDVAMHAFAFPESSLLIQAILRGSTELVLFWSWRRLRRTPLVTEGQLIAIDALVFGTACLGVSLTCLSFGGFASHYAAGIPLVLICRTALVHAPWQKLLVPLLVSTASYPFAQLGFTLFSARAAAQLHDPAAVTIFCGHLLQILTTICFVLIGSHAVWALRRQIYEARNIDRYRLVQRLGRGGMGEVWLARHTTMQREVALKMLRPDRAHDQVAQRRFEREVRAMMQLTHPNSVRVFDYGVSEDGLMYYAMEFLAGQDLGQYVATHGALPAREAVSMMREVCAAVGEAHALDIVHRDLKPENIFVCGTLAGEPRTIKVLDFGIAKRTGAQLESALTQFEQALGTPQYMSPEVAVGRPADKRSDVYALGAVLYFMLAGKPPFHGRSNTAVMIAHSQEHPRRPSATLAAPIPQALEELVMRCLAKQPEQRYADAAELERALKTLS